MKRIRKALVINTVFRMLAKERVKCVELCAIAYRGIITIRKCQQCQTAIRRDGKASGEITRHHHENIILGNGVFNKIVHYMHGTALYQDTQREFHFERLREEHFLVRT